MKKPLLIGGSLFAVALMGLGCNPFKSVEDRVSERVGRELGERLVEGSSGGSLNVNAEGEGLPADFPVDVPRYPNAVYAVSYVKDPVAIANFTTPDEPQAVADWFESQLMAGGFTKDEALNMGGLFRTYKKGNVRITVQAMRSEGESKTSVSIQRAVTKGN